MKKISTFLLILILIVPSLPSFATSATKNIKLAILDNPETDASNPLLSQDLRDAYMQGVKTAIAVAKTQGINITNKTFFYGNNLLELTQQVPNVKAWGPDAIMGLYSSNASLMANSFFTDQLVLSISATDIQLTQLPSNFYSLGVPDLYTIQKLVKFISTQFPNRNLLMVVGADSKESVDVSNLFMSFYKNQNPTLTVTQNLFLSDEADTLDPKTLMKGYTSGTIILFFAIPGSYNIQIGMMNKIADYLAPNKLTFITTVDNWKSRTLLENTNDTKNPYTAFRLDSLFVDTNSKPYKTFTKNFIKVYHTEPTDAISFVTYQTVMSFVTALKQYPAPKNLDTKQAILWSYQQALKHNPNWFRLMQLKVYQLKGHKEIDFATLQ